MGIMGYIPYYGYCRILIINRIFRRRILGLERSCEVSAYGDPDSFRQAQTCGLRCFFLVLREFRLFRGLGCRVRGI